jgi:ubiquinone/menaquinone biosynthesis C-methylase UbiE
MTLHHVQDIPSLLEEFFSILHPGGWLCVADLDPDFGKFHEDNTGVFHYGFERVAQMTAFKQAGFHQVHSRTAATMTKTSADGENRAFSIALISGRKPR